ncbi:thioredoxin family protein [Hellea balneolensis]|uniref:thioredoxin family protein n=1 Tax=Hellea balneolensis TaxID=287478 RepID=UPI00040E914E|nr:thioredoxin family protein [Hellea balneolensis]
MKYVGLSISALLAACTTQALEGGDKPPAVSEVQSKTADISHDNGGHAHKVHDEPRPYDATADAELDVNHTLVSAKENGKLGLLVFGANWCHDSRALAAHFERPRFQTLLKKHFEMTYVDVGQKNRNIELAQSFGVKDIVGTPTVFVTNSDGMVLNLDTAPTWRNAASRAEGDVFDYFEDFTADFKGPE